MKKISLFLFLLLIGGSQLFLFAQSPSGFNYQAVIRDGSGDVLANQNVNLRIRILQSSASGTAVHSETFSKTTNAFGLVNVIIGTSGDLSGINWGSDSFFIETAVDISGGTNFTVLGTSQLMSVPYAMYAANSASDGTDGQDGASAYQVWLDQGNSGSQADFINSLKGEDGQDGAGVTAELLDEVNANTSKVGITPEQASAIEANTLKVGITEEQITAIEANSTKVGITEEQATAIEANSVKVGITEEQSIAIDANTEKVGITEDQAMAIVANTAKVGITEEQATAIETNSADPDTDETNEIQDLEVIGSTLRITGNESATQISLGGRHYAGDIKHSFASTNHGGWYLLDGADLSTLPETAQAAANSIGIFGSLPDARDRFLKGNADGQSSATTGGSNSITIAQENLEPFALTVTESEAGGQEAQRLYTDAAGNHNHSSTNYSTLTDNMATVGTSGLDNVWRGIASSSTTGQGGEHTHSVILPEVLTHSHSVGVTTGGSSVPLAKPAFLSTNVFIYLGESSVADLIALGQNNQEIMNSGISPSTMVSEGLLTLEELVDPANPQATNYDYINNGVNEPVTLQVLVNQGFDLATLYEIYDYDLLIETDVTSLTLFNIGITIAEMANDIDKVGIQLSEFVTDMIAFGDLNASGLYSLQDLDNFFDAATMLTIATVAELLAEDGSGTDITVFELLAGGAVDTDFHGVAYQGGLIFYTQPNGTTYIAEDNDQSTGIIWAMDGSVSTMNAIGAGQANTTAIVAFDPGVNAATTCNDLIDGDTFSDWYLPSRSELQEMYANLKVKGFGNFTDAFYWSSSEVSNSRAEAIDFTDGQSATGPVDRERTNTHRVRAIRSFVSAPN